MQEKRSKKMSKTKEIVAIFVVGGVMALVYHFILTPVVLNPIQKKVEETIK